MSNELNEKFLHFTNAIEVSLETKNWYAALLVALTLPDICGYLENPEEKSSRRYVKWFNSYMTPKYTKRIGPSREEHIFLNGNDAYALRCSYLHSGTFHTDNEWIRDALNKFRFVTTPNNQEVHLNQSDQTLQLQVDLFCLEICEAVREWSENNKNNTDILNLTETMIEIEHLVNGFAL
jgi:hypothetical protein